MERLEKIEELLRCLTSVVSNIEVPESVLRECRAQSIYGNLALEQPGLTIERVRAVLEG